MSEHAGNTIVADRTGGHVKRFASKRFLMETMKRCVVRVSETGAFERLLHLLEHWRHDDGWHLPVLTYHRVDQPARRKDLQPGLISATPDQFESQMRYLHERRVTVTLQDVIAAVTQRQPLPKRAILVTFDDAYEDFALHAWPVLQRYGIPCVMFVATDYPGNAHRRFWWDSLHAALECPLSPDTANASWIETPCGRFPLKTSSDRRNAYRQLRSYLKSIPHEQVAKTLDMIWQQRPGAEADNGVMDWQTLRRLAHEGLVLAPHTQSHPLLTRLDDPVKRQAEIEQSWMILEQQIGSTPRVFAYPSGAVDAKVTEQVRDLRMELAFTTQRGVNDLRHASPWLLKRINVGQLTNVSLLRTQLAVLN